MSKKIPGCVRVVSNLIQQDCYVRDCSVANDLATVNAAKTYLTLNEKVVNDDNGSSFVQEFVEVPYPITPESVNSYVESTDYRRDPVAAVLNAPKRENLGDVSVYQDVLSMDSEQARTLYSQLSERFGSKTDVTAAAKTDVTAAAKTDVTAAAETK